MPATRARLTFKNSFNFKEKELKYFGPTANSFLPPRWDKPARISGITPCDISVLAVYIEKLRRIS